MKNLSFLVFRKYEKILENFDNIFAGTPSADFVSRRKSKFAWTEPLRNCSGTDGISDNSHVWRTHALE